MRFLVPVLAPTFCLLACNEPETLTGAYGKPCYEGPAETRGIGACRDGVTSPSATSSTAVCLNQVLPSLEQCDLIDHDCDGDPKGPSEEVCDGIDNDCDGAIDEEMPLEFCYEGPAHTVNQGVCSPGVRECVRGSWSCERQRLPAIEICNSLDDDCDGETDEGSNPVRSNVVLVIDNSGSMDDYLNEVRALFAGVDHQWFDYWVFNVPVARTDEGGPNPVCHPTTPLEPCRADVLASWANNWRQEGGSREPVYDVLYDIYTGVYDIEWIQGRQRTIIVMVHETDNGSFSNRGLTESDLAAVAISPYLTIVYASDQTRFDSFATTNSLVEPSPLTPTCR